jgi:UDP-N-acetylmuramoylalanine--D-glutamate ligase
MRVAVLGLAATGEAVVRHFAGRGDDVVVLEDRPGARDYDERVVIAQAAGATVIEKPTPADVSTVVSAIDLLVPSPGVPERHPAIAASRKRRIPVRSEIDLAAEIAAGAERPTLLAVTGTNGKTTVTSLAAAMLDAAGVRVTAAGNIGRPLLDAVHDDVDVIVAEVSSFQLAFTEVFRPRAAALLNLGADHLDWHRTFDAYARAKANIFARQRGDDLLTFNADDPVVAGLAAAAPAHRVPFSVADGAAAGYRVVATATGALLVADDGTELAPLEALSRRAPHDIANALAAAAIARAAGATPDAIATALASAAPLAHRMGLVAEHDGVGYIDDSKATNVHATLAAVRGLDHVVLIAGGRNKGLDLSELRSLAPRLRAVVAIGDAAPEIVQAFTGAVPVTVATNMRDAVRTAAEHAQPGDTVLLSPACASFDWYGSYAERGADFAREVRELVEVGS